MATGSILARESPRLRTKAARPVAPRGLGRTKMAKFCANGHQMEDSWEICPYCQKTGYVGTGLGKTRVESDPIAAPAGAARKTVLLSEKRKAPVVGWFV